jgi:putative transposase
VARDLTTDPAPRPARHDCQRQRHGVHFHGHPGLGRGPARRLALHRARKADAERVCRVVQRQDARRAADESLFFTLDHARDKIAAWALDSNTRRPHSSIGNKTPAAYAARLTATGRSAAQCGSSTARPVAPNAPKGVNNPETLVLAG